MGRDWSAAVPAANLLLESSAGADSGCGFSLSRPREGRQLPSVRDANGGAVISKDFEICAKKAILGA